MRKRPLLLCVVSLLTLAAARAQPPANDQPRKPPEAAKEKASEKKTSDEEAPVVTHHEIKLGEKTLKYTATAGMLPIHDTKGEVEAHIFFVAYTLDDSGPAGHRPLMFSFNGGPGSASVWLHIGALGPKRVEFPSDGSFPAPPYRLVDNDATWLDRTDLVFIDPVGTGFSRAVKPELTRKFHGVTGDIESVGEFIRLYLTRYDRWLSPLYLVGESYGTTRAAGLAGYLVDVGIAFNGIALLSTVLNFQTLSFAQGHDLPYVLYLPTYTATAWYHKKLAPELQGNLRKTLDEAEQWAETEYAQALMKGDRLKDDERRQIVERLAKYTGLDPKYVENSNLRIEIQRFCKELLRSQNRTVGRLDSRFKGIDSLAVTERPEADPSLSAIRPAFTATFNQYVRAELGYKTDRPYYILGEGVGPWDWGPSGRGLTDVSDSLRDALAKNPHMQVFVGSGYYDLATPYRATEYTLAHMNLDPAQRRHFHTETYEAGHMMYIHAASLEKLKKDITGFLEESLRRP